MFIIDFEQVNVSWITMFSTNIEIYRLSKPVFYRFNTAMIEAW